METKKTTSLMFANHQVTICTFTEAYTIQADDLNNQTLIAWDGQQMGKDITDSYFLKKGDIIMPNKWLQHKNSMTIAVINHNEIGHELTVGVSDCLFFNGEDYNMRYEVKNVTISFKYWIMSPKGTLTPSSYNTLVESAAGCKILTGDFLKTGFPIEEDSIEKRLKDIIAQATKNAIMQQQPVDKSALATAIKKAIDDNRYDLFKKYGLNYKDLQVVPDIDQPQDDVSLMINEAIRGHFIRPIQEAIDNNQTDHVLVKKTNEQKIKLAEVKNDEEIKNMQDEGAQKREMSRANHDEEIQNIQAKGAQKREELKPELIRLLEALNQNLAVIKVMVEGGRQGLNLNGCNPIMDLLKPKQQIETAKSDQNVRPVAHLS